MDTLSELRSPPVPKGTVSSGTVNFDSGPGGNFTLTNGGAHAWAFNFQPGYNVFQVLVTNAGAFAITLPSGIKWWVGDGSTSTSFSAQGIILQASGVNIFLFETWDGGANIYGLVR